MTPRRALSTATPSWQVAAWPGRRARSAEGGPGLPDAVRAYLSPACLQYATMVSRAGRVGQSRGVASESLQLGPAAGRSGRLSTGKGGVRARQSTPHPALVAAGSQWESRWRPLIGRAASGNRGRARGELGKRGRRVPVTFPGVVAEGGTSSTGQDPDCPTWLALRLCLDSHLRRTVWQNQGLHHFKLEFK